MTWLVAIARHRAIDFVRQRREVSLGTDEDGTDPLEAIAGPGDLEAEFIDNHRLATCLGRLDDVRRRCLLAAYHEGRSRDELAAAFDRPVNTIKPWLHRSAASLRLCLDER